MSSGVMPIVRLQLEGFREAITVALSQRHFEIDTYVQDAIDKALDPAAIKQLIDREATAAVETCVKQAIESYFRWGPGMRTIRDIAEEKLNEAFNARPPGKDL